MLPTIFSYNSTAHVRIIGSISPAAQWDFSNFFFKAPNASTDYSDPFTFVKDGRDDLGAKITWTASNFLTLRAGYKYINDTSDGLITQNYNFLTTGQYSQFVNHYAGFNVVSQDAYAFADVKFMTGPVSHKVTTGAWFNSDSALVPTDE